MRRKFKIFQKPSNEVKPSLTFTTALEKKGPEQQKRIRMRAYRLLGTLKQEFTCIEEARDFAAAISNKFPGVLFEPYEERRRGIERRSGEERRSGKERRAASANR